MYHVCICMYIGPKVGIEYRGDQPDTDNLFRLLGTSITMRDTG